MISTTLDRDSIQPLYQQIAQRLEQMILSGSLKSGSKLPSESQLTAMFDVSRITLRQAVGVLVDKNLLSRRQGKGTYVQATIHHDLTRHGLLESLLAQSADAEAKLLSFKVSAPPAFICRRLGLSKGDTAFQLDRLYSVADSPVALGRAWINAPIPETLSAKAAEFSTEQLLAAAGVEIVSADISIRAEACSKDVGRLLSIPAGRPLLVMQREAQDAAGHVREIVTAYFRSEAYEFNLTRTAAHGVSDVALTSARTQA